MTPPHRGKGQVRSNALTCLSRMQLCDVKCNYCIMFVHHRSLCIRASKGLYLLLSLCLACGEVTRTAEILLATIAS